MGSNDVTRRGFSKTTGALFQKKEKKNLTTITFFPSLNVYILKTRNEAVFLNPTT